MRSTILWLTIGLVLVGAAAFAYAEDESPSDDLDGVRARIDVLESQVAYLMERERSLTTYVVGARERGKSLVEISKRMRAQGFQNRSIPAESRETLLIGLERIGYELQAELPVVSKAQAALLLEARRAGR